MAEVLTVFEAPVSDELGTYQARAVGRPGRDGMWEGWIEFVPAQGRGDVLVTGVETTQPERSHVAYWATGLTPVYLEGALRRARTPTTVRVRVVPPPASDAPAPRVAAAPVSGAAVPAAVLDPFEIGERSLDVLAQELRALNRPRLQNIIAAYGLNPGGEDLSGMTDAQLATFIVVAVETQMSQRVR
jgi:hypothetical protein